MKTIETETEIKFEVVLNKDEVAVRRIVRTTTTEGSVAHTTQSVESLYDAAVTYMEGDIVCLRSFGEAPLPAFSVVLVNHLLDSQYRKKGGTALQIEHLEESAR